jgi:pyruvate, orthophosphate dikinase
MTSTGRFESTALRVNLEKTRTETLSFPDEHQLLLDAASSHYGIQKRLRHFLVEYHHRFPNREELVEALRQIVLQDLWFYAAHEQAPALLRTLLSMFCVQLSAEYPLYLRKRALQTLLELLEHLYEREDAERFAEDIDVALELIEASLMKDSALLTAASSLMRALLHGLPHDARWEPRLSALLREALDASIRYWSQQTDVERWLEERPALFPGRYDAVIDYAGRPFFEQQRTLLEASANWNAMTQVADHAAAAERIIGAAELFHSPLEKISWLFIVIHHDGMEGLREQLLRDINRALKLLRDACDEKEWLDFLENVFVMFAELRERHLSSILDCIQTLGREVHATASQRLIDAFIEHLVNFGFVTPHVSGITDDWQVNVDRNHIKNIRVWLALIQLHPASWRHLLSALLINLKLGGVFISDTDLFQRDVTALLNSDIGRVYYLVKQLMALFPVYFNEIGAEGELRDISTVIDELSQRSDRLIHFLRKQVHAESNNLHIRLTDGILRYWFDGTTDALLPMLPADVAADLTCSGYWYDEAHAAVRKLCAVFQVPPEVLSTLSLRRLEDALKENDAVEQVHRTRVRHLLRIKQLLTEKYTIDVHDIVPHMEKHPAFRRNDIDELERLLASGEAEKALAFVLDAIRRLRNVILDPAQTTGVEDIYYKRHIAAGIPSMYGRYLEPKFQAMGLTFRFEALASQLVEKLISETNLRYITAPTLKRIARILSAQTNSLAIEGLSDEGFNSTLEMFRYSLTTWTFSIAQFMNLFQFMAANVTGIITENFIQPHDSMLTKLIRTMHPDLAVQQIHALSEQFYRDLIAGSFPVPQLDSFIASVVASLNEMVRHLPSDAAQGALTYESRLISTRLYQENADIDNPVFLGAKGHYLKKMVQFGFPVPTGFVLTTELFRRRPVLTRHPDMRAEVEAIIADRVHDLEIVSGKTYGDPDNPLLLSVRSGAAISIPGAMNTFLNVGMNESIVEGLSRRPNYGWTSWDCYRRFLQGWGMAYGIDRDAFDGIMMRYKEEYGVSQKIMFTPEQMREIASTYKEVLLEHEVHIEEEPFRQLIQAILSVLDSWYTDRAKVYRSKLNIAEDWGTAVVVQQMVLGNLNYDSGTGVLFTRDPFTREPGISLYGDFTICSQGEDIVGGLVHVLPISEQQRTRLVTPQPGSLESDFPEIYNALLGYARELVNDRGFGHQEIEFTFETKQAQDLYILQTRDHSVLHESETPVFDREPGALHAVGTGLGIGGGAMNGIVCFDMLDLEQQREKHPDAQMILVRPDTVPDDIGMIFECDGLLTARGGAASHAAVTAVRLRKTCVVDCRDMVVDEQHKKCTIGPATWSVGDCIAIDGRLGCVYTGTHPISYEKIQFP